MPGVKKVVVTVAIMALFLYAIAGTNVAPKLGLTKRA